MIEILKVVYYTADACYENYLLITHTAYIRYGRIARVFVTFLVVSN